MGDQPEDAPAVENSPPPVNPPIQPIAYSFWSSKQIKPGTGGKTSLCNGRLYAWHRQNEATAPFDEKKTALNGYFAARRKRQNPGESVDTFIQDVYRLAANCEYGTLKDELIEDWIIVGVLDDTLSNRLQAKSDLTLADAARMSRQAEARKQNRTVARGVETQNEVDYVSQPRSHNKQQTTHLYVQKKSPPRMTVPVFGVDARTMTGSIA